MKQAPTFKEVLDCINSGHNNSKANCSVGLFISECSKESRKEIDNFIVKKPMVTISSFTEENELFYQINFDFKSFNDADYKQLWKFICKFAEKAKSESNRLNTGENLEKLSILSISIVPEKYNGKYFAYIDMPFYETLSRSENAFDGTATISFVCEEESFGVLATDDDIIDRRSIEREIEQEIFEEEGVSI